MTLRLLASPKPEAVPTKADAGTADRQKLNASDPLGALAAQSRAGDVGAQRTLLVALGPAMLRVVRGVLGATHSDVDDTLQEAMVGVHLALSGFRGECSTLHFACRIAVQTALKARRRAGTRTKHTPSSPPEELSTIAGDERSPAEVLMAARRRDGLRQLLLELPEPQAEVLALHAMLGYTIEETAKVTAVPINTVRSRLRNALSKLRVRLEGDHALSEMVQVEL